jgi:DNA repair exonuclease SbcCD nuclease subunit
MKIAVTADLHLDTNYPARSHALGDILEQLEAEGISDLIIAGDLFDKDGDDSAYPHLLDPCRAHPSVRLHVIPGNHDPEKSLRDVSLENLLKYLEPATFDFDGFTMLFLPYRNGVSMGDSLLAEKSQVGEGPWGFVGHGDFIEGQREPNPRKKGVYMPLKQGDLNDPDLRQVFLGHIHKPTPFQSSTAPKVIYPGSPQGLDVTESGPRRFLVYDTESDEVFERKVNCSLIYLNETILVVPSSREKEALIEEFKARLDKPNLTEDELREKTRLRLRVEGFALDKDALVESFSRALAECGVGLYEDSNPNFDGVLTASDPQKKILALDALRNLDQLAAGTDELFSEDVEGSSHWDFGGNEPTVEQVKMAALRAVYQAK